MKHIAALAGVGFGLAASFVSAAPVTLQNFNSPGAQQSDPSQPFFLDQIYGSWGAPFATLDTQTGQTDIPDRFQVRSHNYGSAYKYLGAEFDAGTNDSVQLNFTVSEGVAGCIVDLVDANNNGIRFASYGLVPGGGTNGGNDYTFTYLLSSGSYFAGSGVLDIHHISQMNIEIDPGPSNDFYTASFNDVTLVPEPTGLALCGIVCGLIARRSRR